jgi:hypothetical protein
MAGSLCLLSTENRGLPGEYCRSEGVIEQSNSLKKHTEETKRALLDIAQGKKAHLPAMGRLMDQAASHGSLVDQIA